MLNIHIFARKVGEKDVPNSVLNIEDGGFVTLGRIHIVRIVDHALQIVNWSASCQLGFLTLLRLFEIFVSFDQVTCL